MTLAFTISSNLLFKHIANRLSAWHAPSNRANMLIDFCQGSCAWPLCRIPNQSPFDPISIPIQPLCACCQSKYKWGNAGYGDMATIAGFHFYPESGNPNLRTTQHPFYTYLYWLYIVVRWAECLTDSIWLCFQFDKADLVVEWAGIGSREQSSHKLSC